MAYAAGLGHECQTSIVPISIDSCDADQEVLIVIETMGFKSLYAYAILCNNRILNK